MIPDRDIWRAANLLIREHHPYGNQRPADLDEFLDRVGTGCAGLNLNDNFIAVPYRPSGLFPRVRAQIDAQQANASHV